MKASNNIYTLSTIEYHDGSSVINLKQVFGNTKEINTYLDKLENKIDVFKRTISIVTRDEYENAKELMRIITK